jgi:hypothetical protein
MPGFKIEYGIRQTWFSSIFALRFFRAGSIIEKQKYGIISEPSLVKNKLIINFATEKWWM